MSTAKVFVIAVLWAKVAIHDLSAQLYNNGQVVFISPGATLLVQGDLYNKGTVSNASLANDSPNKASIIIQGNLLNEGFLFNYGSVTLAGNWDNRASYQEGNGTLLLIGNRTQRIRHNNQAIYSLIIDGAGEKIWEDGASITHNFSLQNGLLTPGDGSVFLLHDGVVVSGGGINSYVNGRLFHEGTGYKFYPIGKNGTYSPLTLEDILGASPVTGFEVFTPNPYLQKDLSLSRISSARYWQRTQLSGGITEARIGLSFDDKDLFSNLDSVVVAEAKDESSAFTGLGQKNVTGSLAGGTVVSKENVSGKIFALGTSSPAGLVTSFFIPNALAPASSNEEEKTLKLYGGQFVSQNFLFSVFDRWGNLVYQSQSLEEMRTKGWEGNNQSTGRLETNGVFTYLLRAKLVNGQPFQKAGTITLIR